MEENQANMSVTEQTTSNDTLDQTNVSQENNGSNQTPPDRTFTRDEVTQILKKRIDRYSNSMYKKYGVKDSAELDSLFEKAKGYDDISRQNSELSEKIAFLSNNINPDRYDDIRTYFKGKGLTFSEDLLKTHLTNHPEWLNKSTVAKPTTVIKVGNESTAKTQSSEKELAKRLYGDDLFD